jgi:hypothetical protein
MNRYQATTMEDEDSKPLDRVFRANIPKVAIYIQKIHVRGTWAWLALPAVLLLLALLLLVATVMATGYKHLGIWRDNSLAILYHTK